MKYIKKFNTNTMDILNIAAGIILGLGLTKLYEGYSPLISKEVSKLITKFNKCRKPKAPEKTPSFIPSGSTKYMNLNVNYGSRVQEHND